VGVTGEHPEALSPVTAWALPRATSHSTALIALGKCTRARAACWAIPIRGRFLSAAKTCRRLAPDRPPHTANTGESDEKPGSHAGWVGRSSRQQSSIVRSPSRLSYLAIPGRKSAR
jgi:hypothetical protein